MKLPYYQNAVVPQAKITNYLLSPTHRDGHGKEQFFTRFGFARDDWRIFANALLQHCANNEVAKIEDSPFVKRYVIDGIIQTPDGRNPNVRSVWFIENAEQTPRFVTAYPLARRGK